MGIVLLLVAVLIISAVMLRSHIFGKVTPSVGMLAGAIGFAYYIGLTVTEIPFLLLIVVALLFMLWIILSGLRLFMLARASR